MNQITGYQLQRAATSGWTALTAPVKVNDIIEKVIAGLNKVYADKNVKVTLDVDALVEFHGDEGDLLEIVGNLLDNAYKWCEQTVNVSVRGHLGLGDGHRDIFLSVQDDGSGVPPEMAQYVMQRGRRADSEIAGHGIGLSIVRDIVQVYGGNLEITASRLGGAAINVWLPMSSISTGEAEPEREV